MSSANNHGVVTQSSPFSNAEFYTFGCHIKICNGRHLQEPLPLLCFVIKQHAKNVKSS